MIHQEKLEVLKIADECGAVQAKEFAEYVTRIGSVVFTTMKLVAFVERIRQEQREKDAVRINEARKLLQEMTNLLNKSTVRFVEDTGGGIWTWPCRANSWLDEF